MLPDTYVQSLVAAALDYVDAPLPPPPYQVTVPETAPEQDGAGAAGKPQGKGKRVSRRHDAASRASPALAAEPAAGNPAGQERIGTQPAAAGEGGGRSAATPAAGVDNATLAALLLADDAEPDEGPAAPGGDGAAGTGAGCGACAEGSGPLGHAGEVGHHALFALPEAPELPPELAGEPGSPMGVPERAPALVLELLPEPADQPGSTDSAHDQGGRAELSLQAAPRRVDARDPVAQPPAQAGAPATPAPAEALLDPVPAQVEAPAQAGAEAPLAQAAQAQNPERDLATALGALYAAYTLFETQPGAAVGDQGIGSGSGPCSGPRALLYVPPSRLLALGRLAAAAARAGVRDAVALLRRLIRLGALVVGAVRRPPCGMDLLAAGAGWCDTITRSLCFGVPELAAVSMHTRG